MAIIGRKFKKRMMIVLLAVVGVWTLLTCWVEMKGPARSWVYGDPGNPKKALILYDPDPIYNLDEQVCRQFGETLAQNGWFGSVKTVRAAKKNDKEDPTLYVFCANTYNWAPDWSMTGFIRRAELDGKKVIAITLGSGSTKRSKRTLEKIIHSRSANLVDSRTFWLLRPNDESRLKEKNVRVALSMVKDWATIASTSN